MQTFGGRAVVLVIRRILGGGGGRPLASAVLACLVVLGLYSELPDGARAPLPDGLRVALDVAAHPQNSLRDAVFDAYQKVAPRQPRSQPVTVVAIDEKSLSALGQWPWPRDRMADLVRAVNEQEAAAIGLGVYMPEADQNSPDRLADRVPPDRLALREALRALPSSDAVLAQALAQAPSVLVAAGFEFPSGATVANLRAVPMRTVGGDPRSHLRHFPHVLASLPMLQAASRGQALLSVDAQGAGVRRLPLVAYVGDQLVPGLAMEMFRVASGSPLITVDTGPRGVSSVQVADLQVPTQPGGDFYLHYASQAAGMARNVSAVDVLRGQADPALFKHKLVLIGLTGFGLSDVHVTPLGEPVPGIEIQAQAVEALFDGVFLVRPWWFAWMETGLLVLLGGGLIWLVPRPNTRFASVIKSRPQVAFGYAIGAAAVLLVLGFVLFVGAGLLFDAANLAVGLALVVVLLIGSAMTKGLGEARAKLARLVDNGIALGRAQTRELLLRRTLEGAREIARCQAATLFLVSDRDTLAFGLRTQTDPLPMHELPLHDPLTGEPCHSYVATHVALTGKSVVIDDVRTYTALDLSGTRRFSEASGLQVVSMLNVPLRADDGQVMGVMQLLNCLDTATGEPIPFDSETVGFVEALAAQVAVAIENKNLLEAQLALMDSMIKIIAGAIDTKSPYTGGHCERVPELAMMLAKAACEVKEGPLADFEFKTDEEWREFRIGAWLHDCGKVTTPEYVVDKATKLETIFNRIHEIRTRFEVLLRDAQIERLQAIHERHEPADEAQTRFEARQDQLMADFAFVAECNLGGEFMAPDKVARLRGIAEHTWLRHFDDRLGLSHEELKRFESMPVPPLPACEHLLADKPCHLFERPPNKALDAKYGFKLKVPDHLYNHGELHNLGIGRGTLTDEERFKINEHVIQTIVMLEQMPLPKNLKRVPEYAGTHHETLIGTGYPRKLDGKALSVPSRIMAIADIFEALTASDRPYKKAKTLSESIKILSFFKKDQHIDPVIFDLFLTSGIYMRYAERFLSPEQIDEVDISAFVG